MTGDESGPDCSGPAGDDRNAAGEGKDDTTAGGDESRTDADRGWEPTTDETDDGTGVGATGDGAQTDPETGGDTVDDGAPGRPTERGSGRETPADSDRGESPGRAGRSVPDHEPMPSPVAEPVATVKWLLVTEREPVAFTREFARSALAVLAIGLVLFAVSGVWPPMVAVESPSMEPHMQPGDLVFLMDEHRLVPPVAEADTGVATYRSAADAGTGYRRFGDYGDVVVFATPRREGRGAPPIIHRARFYVEEGENWYDQADADYLRASECGDSSDEGLRYCPAPYDGFITKGDGNPFYDQSQGLSPPVRPEWVRGTAEARVPWLGCVRLYFEGGVPPNCRP
jgi:signal peptidase